MEGANAFINGNSPVSLHCSWRWQFLMGKAWSRPSLHIQWKWTTSYDFWQTMIMEFLKVLRYMINRSFLLQIMFLCLISLVKIHRLDPRFIRRSPGVAPCWCHYFGSTSLGILLFDGERYKEKSSVRQGEGAEVRSIDLEYPLIGMRPPKKFECYDIMGNRS